MPTARLAVLREPLSVEGLTAVVEHEARTRGEGCGALAVFVGVVHGSHQGRGVRHLEYEAFEPLALKTFERIEAELAGHWPAATLGLHHRTGRLGVGDASVVIVVG